MASIMDYLLWRGDLSFKDCPFNEIDGLIMSQLAYTKIDTLISDDFKTEMTLRELAYEYAIMMSKEITPQKEASVINPLTEELLQAMGESVRFGTMRLRCFISIFDTKKQEQFATYAAHLDDNTLCVVYRGTDESITGWKEDFNLCVLNPIPGQKDACKYLEIVAKKMKGTIRLMGHSKGGNFAMYAGAFCSAKTSKRIINIYSYDGPGFLPEITAKPEFQQSLSKIESFVPQASLVGMLLDHPQNYTIVHSNEKTGITQHDPFSWILDGPSFETLDARTQDSVFMEKTTNIWLNKLNLDERKKFLSTLFTIIDKTGVKSVDEFGKNWSKHSAIVFSGLRDTDSETREILWKIIQLFFQAARANIPQTNALKLFLSQFSH
jgi:hypothetical protein